MSIISYSDEEFLKYHHAWAKHIQEIKLPADINSQIGQTILSDLDEAYAYIRIDFGEIDAAREKAESIIRQKERSEAIGRNEDERKKNATEYLEKYPTQAGTTVNMYEWYRLLMTRHRLIKSLVDVIENKQQRLITMSGLMKIDSNLGSNTHAVQ